jgi:prepilin-type N-terminal cleavage/methylation domain-containing protein
MTRFRRHAGFTIVELIVVVAIIAVLAAVVIFNIFAARSRARDVARRVSIGELEKALEVYYSEHQAYPITSYAPNCSTNGAVGWVLTYQNAQNQNWIPGLVSQYIAQLPQPLTTQNCFYVGLTMYGYKSCDGNNYRIIYNCAMENPITNADKLYDSTRGSPFNAQVCRGAEGCANSGIY